MTEDELNEQNTPEAEQNIQNGEETVPIGIARIREEWRAAGLTEQKIPPPHADDGPVVFPEIDGGAGVGDYTLDCETTLNHLALSHEAMDRLISSGEIDSILVQGPDGRPRRLLSESSVNRFQEDSAIDPDALTRAAKAMADSTVAESIRDLQAEIEELRNTQGKVLQQMKDILLLEVRNLKEQERDLTSFVYELAEELKNTFGKKRR
ncbi:MAG: hypothetical protein ABFD54_07805 [Armatimonadota bacterium]